jgi:uncharacterized repeat protein (TIGR01451 family)
MKKIILIVMICLAANFGAKAQYVTIPDNHFGHFLDSLYPTCLQFDSAANKYKMDTTCNDLFLTIDINCSNKSIVDITGIQYFKNLTKLNCSFNNLKQLPVSALPSLYLSYLDCSHNEIDSLGNFSSYNLLYFNCSFNKLKNIKGLSGSMDDFYCNHNLLTSLPDLKGTFALTCNNNLLTILQLPSSIFSVTCDSNLLVSITGLTNASNLISLWCANNNLTCFEKLPANLNHLICDTNKIKCLPNKPSLLNTTLPICNATNNPNNCPIPGVFNPWVIIPDNNFGHFLDSLYPTCLKYDSAANKYKMDTTCSGVVNETSLFCGGKKIKTLDGIQYFKNLDELDCGSNQIDSLINLPANLRNLFCSQSELKYLSNLPKNLYSFECSFNSLTSLPTLPNSLVYLECFGNNLASLPTLPNKLKLLKCYENKLTSLPTLPNSLLTIVCHNNFLTSLPTLPDSLNAVSCSNNMISSLPTLPIKLGYLYCSKNLLSSLPKLPKTLREIDIVTNNIYCLPKLPENLKFISLDSSKIHCIPNIVNGLKINVIYLPGLIDSINLPICNPTNNANQCQSFPYIYGRVFTDNNSNGVKDANEFYRPFVKITSNTGDETFSNINGKYVITLDSIGSFTLKATAPPFYKAVPDSSTVNFSNYNSSLGLPDIALQPIVTKDSLSIIPLPINNRARPGFGIAYNVGYANAGTTNLFTTTHFNYDSSQLVYDSSSVAIVSNTGNKITVATNSLVAGQTGYFKLYFTIKASVAIGDSLKVLATITAPTVEANAANKIEVRGSFDPNDKIATPTLSPIQVINGDKIEYTIRFQNTGNDTATNVIISDTLSNLLQSGYLEVVSTSHPSNIQYKLINNIFYFEFLNINLPDSGTNYYGSNGWVTFKVKPLPTLTLGTAIDNKAHIYFDYNKDIVTNVARTLIKNIVVPVKIMKYELRGTNEKQVINDWAVANEINVSHYNVQRSINGKEFTTVGQVKANGNSSYHFTDPLTINNLPLTIYYRLHVVDNDGRTDYSTIKQIRLNQLTNQLINVYPNPAKGTVNIDCANAKEIKIVDWLGRAVFNKKIINTQLSTINIQQFNKGIYVVQVVLNNGTVMNEKLIVE